MIFICQKAKITCKLKTCSIIAMHRNQNKCTLILGDAILCLWEVSSFLKMKATVGHVLKCAMGIQEKMGEWITGVGVKLRVKIGKSLAVTAFLTTLMYV